MKHLKLLPFLILISLILSFAPGCGALNDVLDKMDEAPEAGDDEAFEGDDAVEEQPDDHNVGEDDDDDAVNDDDDDDDAVEAGTAHFALSLIDAPIDNAESVFITIKEISLHHIGVVGDDDDATGDDDDATGDDDDVAGDDDDDDDSAKAADDDDDAVGDDDDVAGDDDDAVGDDDDSSEEGEGSWINLEITPTRYDLLELQNNVSALLADQEVPVGDYTQLRLKLECSAGNEPTIVIDSVEHELKIPSGCQSGLKMPHNFTLSDGGQTALIMDFDVRRSVHTTGNGQYIMQPVIRLVDAEQVGVIKGQVLPLDIDAVVYAFEAGTFDPGAQDPFENAINSSMPAADGFFSLAALPFATYDIVITADGFETDASMSSITVNAPEETDIGVIELEAGL